MSPRFLLSAAALVAASALAPPAPAQAPDGAAGAAGAAAPFPVRELAPGVYAVPGDTGRGSEGRPNAGFVVTDDGVVAIDALGSPLQGERLVRTIRGVTARPIRWLVLTHHHPDHHFGAVALRRAGARVIAHPERASLATAPGDEDPVAAWTRVVGAAEMRGFRWADVPDVPVSRDTTLRMGGRTIVVSHPGPAHTPGDLVVWLPESRVLFAGDLLVEDGVTMLVDGNSAVLLHALAAFDTLALRVVVPGHGSIPAEPGALVAATRRYVDSLRTAMRGAVAHGRPMSRVLAAMPPVDPGRPVSRASRAQRNAVRVYLEAEREAMRLEPRSAGAEPASASPPPAARDSGDGRLAERGTFPVGGPPREAPAASRAAAPGRAYTIATDSLARLVAASGGPVALLDVRPDVTLYLRSHLPGAVYLNTESLRAADGGVPNMLLPASSYATLFSRLGVRPDRPVVIYAAGESRNIDATYVAWILAGLGHPAVYVLDGGFGKWELEGRPTTRAYPGVLPATWAGRAFEPERATLDDVRRAMGGPGVVLVDARVPEQYRGEAGAQMRRGHIPGAVNHHWESDLAAGGFARVWRPPGELRAAYAAQGITPDKDVIAYCNGGLESSHVYFTLRHLLGYPRVRVYDGSWTEWAARAELPVETGPGRAAAAGTR